MAKYIVGLNTGEETKNCTSDNAAQIKYLAENFILWSKNDSAVKLLPKSVKDKLKRINTEELTANLNFWMQFIHDEYGSGGYKFTQIFKILIK